MVKYVAFLRGINVGGNNIIKMDELRQEFERMKFQHVKTFIQSGNVLFVSAVTDKNKLEKVIEKNLSSKFRYFARVFIRSQKDMEDIIDHLPKVFHDPEWKHNIILLSKALDSKDILNRFEIKKDIEQTNYHQGTLYWSARIDNITRSTMLKLSQRKEYAEMTVRNMNTMNKILSILKDDANDVL